MRNNGRYCIFATTTGRKQDKKKRQLLPIDKTFHWVGSTNLRLPEGPGGVNAQAILGNSPGEPRGEGINRIKDRKVIARRVLF